MGQFMYGGTVSQHYDLDDRLLAHLQLAITAKLRRGEPFAFTLTGRDLSSLTGHRVFWMHPTIGVQFHLETDRRSIPINTAWVRALIMSASSESGLRVTPEPSDLDDEAIETYPEHGYEDNP